jgi:hypothetical protein
MTAPSAPVTTRRAWQALVAHYETVRELHLRQLFAEDPTCEERLTAEMVASFSRALVEGLTAQQTDAEFHARLDASVQSIFEASNT